jgi:hypothetical protein
MSLPDNVPQQMRCLTACPHIKKAHIFRNLEAFLQTKPALTMPRRRRPISRHSEDSDDYDKKHPIRNKSRTENRNDRDNPNSTARTNQSSKADWFIHLLTLCFLASALYTYFSGSKSHSFSTKSLFTSKQNFRGSRDRNDAKRQSDAIPSLQLPSYAQEPSQPLNPWDAYGIAEQLQLLLKEKIKNQKIKRSNADEDSAIASLSAAIEEVTGLLSQFSARYGGDTAARAILGKALTAFQEEESDMQNPSHVPKGLWRTAERFLQAQKQDRPFRMAFAGYSVTVGRGNYFSQSFPFVVEQILRGPLQKMLGVELNVRNAAIGGVPSFPYGWCLTNFLVGSQTDSSTTQRQEQDVNEDFVDVISWDFSMNEAADVPHLMEGYIRNMINSLDSGMGPPMLLVKDTHMATRRRDLLNSYYRQELLADPIVIHTDPAVDPFLEKEELARPSGFQEWRKFGAPPGAPGMAKHHPAVKEHEFIAWVIVMHFLSAIELVILFNTGTVTFNSSIGHDRHEGALSKQQLPPPIHFNESIASSMFYGAPDVKNMSWTMGNISCKTTFEPILSGDINELILSGEAQGLKTMDIMLPKGQMYYNRGWVLDLGEAEKKSKRKLIRYGGLGYVDSKKAYYGTQSSGPLQLFLPNEKMNSTDIEKSLKSVIVCEVNESRGTEACDIKEDISFSVGGVSTQASYVEGVSYLGRQICVHLEIPPSLTAVNDPRKGVESSSPSSQNNMGFILELSVTNKHITKEEACSISHIVWESS